MEVAAKKFELESGILEEINEQVKMRDDLYSYPSSRAQDDGYFPYCTIKFESISNRNDTTQFQPQEQKPVPVNATPDGGTISLNSELSELSTSCAASTLHSSMGLLESSTAAPNNVRNSALVIVRPFLF